MRPGRHALALAFALFYPALMTWVYFVALHAEGTDDNPATKIAYGVGKAVQFLFPAAYVFLFERDRLTLRRPRPAGFVTGTAFGLAVAAAMLLLYFLCLRDGPWFAQAPAQMHTRLQQMGLASPVGFLGIAVFYCVVHSWLEEYYWRWFVFDGLTRWLATAGAMLVSGLGFALHHFVILAVYFPEKLWTLALPLTLAIAVGGVVWAWLYHATRSLVGTWISHALIDAAIMAIGYDLQRNYWA